MEYNKIQTTAPLRSMNSVNAYKILDIRDKHLIFQLWHNDSESRGEVMVSMPEEYKVGQYVDLQVVRMSSHSYKVTLVGHTPQVFIPESGANIG